MNGASVATESVHYASRCGNGTAMECNDPVLEQFTDDDEHVASRRLLDDIDDRVEAEYPGSAFVSVTAAPREGHPTIEASE